jgi:hypothetical protein
LSNGWTKAKSIIPSAGGLALAVYGIPRAIVDIDILIPKELLKKLKTLTLGLGYMMQAKPRAFARGEIEIHWVSKKDEETGDGFFWISLS